VITRRDILITIGAGAAASFTAYAQQTPNKVFRIGLLGVTSAAGYARQMSALRQGLRELGYIEGQNVVIDYRWADGQYDRLNALSAELINLQPDVLITSGPGVRVLKETTTTVPVVMAVGGDVVADGIVASMARPGGNITGSVAFGPELTAKRLEFLKDAVPSITRVAVLLNANNETDNSAAKVSLAKTAAVRRVELFDAPVRSPRDFEQAFAAMRQRHAHGLVALSESMLVAPKRSASKYRNPS
jgi:putative ABC transport system substrate-binding protein